MFDVPSMRRIAPVGAGPNGTPFPPNDANPPNIPRLLSNDPIPSDRAEVAIRDSTAISASALVNADIDAVPRSSTGDNDRSVGNVRVVSGIGLSRSQRYRCLC